MLDEIAARKIKAGLLSEIEHLNGEISKKQKEIDEDRKRIWICQAELSTINKVLEDQA